VSAAKAALESHVRQLAVELAPREITANAIRAGVTATPAAQKIPGYGSLEDRRRAAIPRDGSRRRRRGPGHRRALPPRHRL